MTDSGGLVHLGHGGRVIAVFAKWRECAACLPSVERVAVLKLLQFLQRLAVRPSRGSILIAAATLQLQHVVAKRLSRLSNAEYVVHAVRPLRRLLSHVRSPETSDPTLQGRADSRSAGYPLAAEVLA